MSSEEEGQIIDDRETTALEIEQDEENIERIHERRSLLSEGKKKVKSPTCRSMLMKAVCISIAGILFILMMVELWSDYGNVLNTQTLFPPKVYSVTETCPPNTEDNYQLTKDYNAMTCEWHVASNGTKIHCDGNMPTHALVLPTSHPGANTIHIDGDSMCVMWLGMNISQCVRLIVWSI